VKITGVVLAAGLGKRMKSSLPKVLHTLHGTTMIQYVLNTLYDMKPQKIIVVIGKHFKEIKDSIEQSADSYRDIKKVYFAPQKEPKGTGDALLKAETMIRRFKGIILVVNGDTPLLSTGILKRFLALHKRNRDIISFLSFLSQNPETYGRVIRDKKNHVLSIVEEKDATTFQKKIKEVNSGVYAIKSGALHLLKEIKINKIKGEYYLTDLISIARNKGIKVNAYCIGSEDECAGINTQEEFERVKRLIKNKMTKKWADKGVNFIDGASVFISSLVKIGRGTTIYPNVHLEGHTKIGKQCTIFPNVRILDSVIENSAVIKDSTLIEGSIVKKAATVGPFAHIRPGSEIGPMAKIGNFVEVKKSFIGSGTKASHLSYLGDARIGKDVNIGAGTITCNYDGYTKNITTIKDDVFIGSDSQLIAPVIIGKGAYVGAGSTITKNVPQNALALSRMEQSLIKDWVRKRRLKAKSGKKLKGK
jgi:bifunctional UDP-N-acetylglucosamine pyrophosphorylase/glucosamine-1-phosphate N-acetyltransferase